MVSAHAHLVQAYPAPGSVIAAAPCVATFVFEESLNPTLTRGCLLYGRWRRPRDADPLYSYLPLPPTLLEFAIALSATPHLLTPPWVGWYIDSQDTSYGYEDNG